MAYDIERARFNMVEQQIRTWDVLDPDVLELLYRVRREDYVPQAHRSLAFADLELPLGRGQKMWAPKLEARVLQELAVKAGETVLEIGTGSGYFTALLASRARQVTSVEIDPPTARDAAARLERHGIRNANVAVGDGAQGFGKDRYHVVVLTGSTPVLPEAFASQLQPGGRVFAIVGEAPVMVARLQRWEAPGAPTSTDLFETVVPALMHARQPERFVF